MIRYFLSSINVVFVEALLEKQKKVIGNGETFGALLGDLLKTFADYFHHELLIVKLDTCGLSLPTLKIFYDYLPNVK